ncbi:hypothetical protein [Saccharopolyspora sp. CA-218241]|uniref:hypothetical protein n=1 Tax=Saccharopolyspora sp. CA-218241 TaxID=3240027 RepID=UPI003D982A66
MRLLLGCLACLTGAVLFAVGITSVLVGYAEQRHADRAYVVGFVPGSDCDDGHELYLHTDDGAVLDCAVGGVFGSGHVRLPGFTGAQNDEVEVLAEELGEDGLSTTEQRRIQGLVDGHVAAVPPAERPYGAAAVSGGGRIWLGLGMVVAALLGIAGTLRLVRRPR